MTDVKMLSEVSVDLIDFMGGDHRVVQAAKVSTQGAESASADAQAGLIRYLIKNRHASPTEHSYFTFLTKAPIFVSREAIRHRMSNINEQSGRYMELSPEFYTPGPDRNLVQIGKTGDYKFDHGSPEQHDLVEDALVEQCESAWVAYQEMINAGVAKEVARMVLPLNIYTSWYQTFNARSLMNFLSLRTTNPDATIKSSPQREIEMVAEKMEKHFEDKMPITYKAWNDNGRKAI